MGAGRRTRGPRSSVTVKIAVLGGGGFRAPYVWESVADGAADVSIDALVLHDISAARLARIEAVIDGLRRERGGPPVSTTTSLVDAVEGADVIFCAIRVGGLEGRVVDETVPLREGVLGQETVGPGGICFALRTLPAMLDIARAVRHIAPSAWFLNFTNPAGLVTEALQEELGDRVVGICDAPAGLCARVAAAMRRPVRTLAFDYAGLNHLGWLTGARDGERDLLPELLADERRLSGIEEVRLFGVERIHALGMIPNEYLIYYEAPGGIVEAFRRAGATRAELLLAQQSRFYAARGGPEDALASWRQARDQRFGSYMDEARNAADDALFSVSNQNGASLSKEGVEGPGDAGYAAIAAGFLRAVAQNTNDVVVLNVSNNGRLPFLDDDAVVEVPCTVSQSGPSSLPVGKLPPEQQELVARVKEVERTTIRASLEGSRALALDAIAAHPVVPTRVGAERILAGYLEALPELAGLLR
jgi:6-phospho-beta-glucosidase